MARDRYQLVAVYCEFCVSYLRTGIPRHKTIFVRLVFSQSWEKQRRVSPKCILEEIPQTFKMTYRLKEPQQLSISASHTVVKNLRPKRYNGLLEITEGANVQLSAPARAPQSRLGTHPFEPHWITKDLRRSLLGFTEGQASTNHFPWNSPFLPKKINTSKFSFKCWARPGKCIPTIPYTGPARQGLAKSQTTLMGQGKT